MKVATQFGILLVIVAALYSVDGKPHYDVNNAPQLYVKFINDYNRTFKDNYDLLIHYEAFRNSLIRINKLNSSDHSATYGINKFSDMTEEEKSHFLPPFPVHQDTAQ